jgi:TRAP-type C4-dicarboxylate transport system substrate-binding protein
VAAWYISERRWKALTPQQQDLFKRAAQIGGKLATDLGEQIDAQGLEDLKKVGGIYVVPDKAAFEAAWKDVYKNYEGKVWPVGLVEKIKAAQK